MKRLTFTLALLLSAAAYILPADAQLNGSPRLMFTGSALKAGPALATFTFSGTITPVTVGSFTYGVLSIVQSNTTAPVVLNFGDLISGAGVTTGTVVQYKFPGTDNYYVNAPSAAMAAVATAVTMTDTPEFTPQFQDTLSATAPTYASGGCTAGSPAFKAGSTPYSWTYTNGSGTCTGGNTVTFTFPAATTTWACTAQSTLNSSSDLYIVTGAASTTAVVLTDYSTAGVAQNTKANDVITGTCAPH